MTVMCQVWDCRVRAPPPSSPPPSCGWRRWCRWPTPSEPPTPSPGTWPYRSGLADHSWTSVVTLYQQPPHQMTWMTHRAYHGVIVYKTRVAINNWAVKLGKSNQMKGSLIIINSHTVMVLCIIQIYSLYIGQHIFSNPELFLYAMSFTVVCCIVNFGIANILAIIVQRNKCK